MTWEEESDGINDIEELPIIAGGYTTGYEHNHIHGVEYNFDKICEYAEGQSLIPNTNHIREGCVVKPLRERRHEKIGRVAMKWISAAYLEKSK